MKFFLFISCLFYSALFASDLVFHGTEDTLYTIQELIRSKQKGIYLRFGDGDLNLAYGQHEYDCMKHLPNSELQKEMVECYGLTGPGVLKTLPVYSKELGGFEPGMFPGNHETSYEDSLRFIQKSKAIWGGKMTDVYSHAALHFSATSKRDLCLNFLRFLKESNCCLFVGNQNIPSFIRELLFGSSCVFIPTPEENSYNEIDRIERACLQNLSQQSGYKIVVIASGCAGRVLQKRLWKQVEDVFLFDFGSLMDALCGWNTRAWIELTNFDAEEFIKDYADRFK